MNAECEDCGHEATLNERGLCVCCADAAWRVYHQTGSHGSGCPCHEAERAAELRDALIIAFVQGAEWWEFTKTQATMRSSDVNAAVDEAERRVTNGTLGRPPKYMEEI